MSVETAERIARGVHLGQTDKHGRPYIEHVERVVDRVRKHGTDAESIAWLHDVLEDSPYTAEALAEQRISPRVVEAVELLTRTPPFEYREYIAQIRRSGDRLARLVKIADLDDHLDNDCPKSLYPRYFLARAELRAETQKS